MSGLHKGNSQEWDQRQGPGLLNSGPRLFALNLEIARNTDSVLDVYSNPKKLSGVWGQAQRQLRMASQFGTFQRQHVPFL